MAKLQRNIVPGKFSVIQYIHFMQTFVCTTEIVLFQANKAKTDEEREKLKKQSLDYLERYIYLILFNTYLHCERRNQWKQSFPAWMREVSVYTVRGGTNPSHPGRERWVSTLWEEETILPSLDEGGEYLHCEGRKQSFPFWMREVSVYTVIHSTIFGHSQYLVIYA